MTEHDLRHCRRELAMARLELGEIIRIREQPEPKEGRRLIAVETAEAEYNRGVREPPGEGWERIDTYIQYGLGWTWEKPYTRNRQFAWCGAFMAFCFEAAGLREDIRRKNCASCYRLDRWAAKNGRHVSLELLAPGDVLVVGPKEGHTWGVHITIVRALAGSGGAYTFEGNAFGSGPQGDKYEGVISRHRPYQSDDPLEYRAIYGVRFQAEDFEVAE